MSSSLSVVKVPAAYMRVTHLETDRVVSQAIMGEDVVVLEERHNPDDCYKIRTSDGCVGWVHSSDLFHPVTPYISTKDKALKVTSLWTFLFGTKNTECGERMTVPFGSRLKVVNESDLRWIEVVLPNFTHLYVQRGDVSLNPQILTKDKVVDFAMQFLRVPFSSGGRSSFGFDSSGFSQLLCREMGVSIPRDTRDQGISDKFETIEWTKREPGDFIFFGSGQSAIKQVGLYIGRDKMINPTERNLRTGVSINDLNDSPWNGSGDLTYRVARRLIIEEQTS